ncbi:hypothetical protein FB381_0721 [Nocardioides albertanoniae]|uniref:Uncharacterized protein n=1 Tax=Nocardioides albertanoniae TaxID=1175486 RepID=A0A543A2N8_9ACTN|nr:hypothetical protein [Nocardioides albertanoniae]TQL66855.1 hypothetical protein FB381_0721 [Nocardioides albertanoniae]
MTEPRARHHLLSKRAERRGHLAKVALGVTPLAATLLVRAFGPDGQAVDILVTVAVTWALIAIVIILVMPMMNRRRRVLAERILAAHPDADVITGFASKGTRDHARTLGVNLVSLNNGAAIALGVRPGLIEVWSTGDTEPRWVLDRRSSALQVEVERLPHLDRTLLGIRITDGHASVELIPADRAGRIAAVEAALDALGVDRDDHIRP